MSLDVHVVFANWRALLDGTLITILLMLVVGTVSPVLAIPLAVMRDSGLRLFSVPIAVFSWFTRAVPTLVLLFFTYYGLPALGIFLDPLPSALAALIISALGYNIEFLRAGLLSVPKGQFDAARALGMSRFNMFRRVIFPQAMRVSLPAIFSNLTLNLKGTALAGLVSVPELTANVSGLISETYRPIELLGAAGVIYLALNSVLIRMQAHLEHRLNVRARACSPIMAELVAATHHVDDVV